MLRADFTPIETFSIPNSILAFAITCSGFFFLIYKKVFYLDQFLYFHFASVLLFVCFQCPTISSLSVPVSSTVHVTLLMFTVVRLFRCYSESWTSYPLPRCGRSLAWSFPYLCHLNAAPRGQHFLDEPLGRACMPDSDTVAALVKRTCVLRLISECTSRATCRCCLWLP